MRSTRPEGQKRLDALRDLAGSAQVDDLPAVSLDLLGSALRDAGDPERAEAVLRRAQRRRPDDVWLNYNLAQCLEKLARATRSAPLLHGGLRDPPRGRA